MRIAQTVAARGHQVRVYTQSWEGECPDNFELIRVPVKSRTNHGRNAEYYARCNTICATTLSIGWLDSIRCRALMCITPQTCVTPKSRTGKRIFYRLTSRYRHYAAFERATFEHGKPTQLLMLTNKQIADFQNIIRLKRSVSIFFLRDLPDRKYSQQIPNSRQIYRQKMVSQNSKNYCCK